MESTPEHGRGAAWFSDRGRVRPSNEDAVGADPAHEVYVVADGLGGLPGGERASRVAVETLVATLGARPRDGPVAAAIDGAIASADAAIRGAGAAAPWFAGMATTVVVAVGDGDAWAVAHVGDSRAYLLRGERLCRLTTDHNVAAELVASGRITEEAARHHRGRNIVTRTLGAGAVPVADLRRVDRHPRDRLLLCTDGLSGTLADEEIGEVLRAFPRRDACCRELVARANDRGGPDNITVLVVDC